MSKSKTCETKRKCRFLCSTSDFLSLNLLVIGLLVGTVFIGTINVSSVNAIECGTVNFYREAILGGKEVVKDEWPFVAALYYSKTFEYFCGGTIISHKHILTAAHCMQTKFKIATLTPDEITVRLGAFNLTDRSEKDAINRNVEQIFVHPDWNYNEEKYDADIAILVLNENLTFSDHIRPVCMPPADFLIDGLNGTVVGWGKTENGTAEGIPRKITVSALNDMHCYETDNGIASFTSERTFCGQGSGTPNHGDSGGGFFAVAGSGWVQFGIVSFIRPKEIGNNLRIALYMKLTSLRDWITEKVEQSGGTISVARTKANLYCSYGYVGDWVYGCWLFDLNIRQENFVVERFIGWHDLYTGNEDVEMIVFKTGFTVSLPRNFGKIFRNLKFLVVNVNTTRIFRSNLENLERLRSIEISDSSTAELDENALWDLPNLRSFEMANCKLKFLHAATFSRNYELRTVIVLSNGLTSLPRNLFQNNLKLENVSFADNSIETVDENIFQTNANLRLLSFTGNRLNHLSKHLFRNNALLKSVDVSKNRINFIDEQVFETNAKIEEVSLRSNQLTHISANLFRNNLQLGSIDLGENSIETIDENSFERNSLLHTISLQFNRLVELPRNLFRHNLMLEYVDLSSNLLETIDERFFEWNAKLRIVYIDKNYMSHLPGKLFQNNSLLESVHLKTNSLDAIVENTFLANANLKEVHLSWNMLKYLPEKLFHNNPLLEIVDLSNNLLVTLNENIFKQNVNLEKIYLQSSWLEQLPRNIFQSATRLKYIDLSGNRLNIIVTNFTVLNDVNQINLSGNICTNIVFHSGAHNFSNVTKTTGNLTEFQNLVMDNCSDKNRRRNRV